MGTTIIRPWQAQDRLAAAAVVESVLREYGLPWEPETTDREVLEVESHYLAVGGEFWVVEAQHPEGAQVVGTGGYFPIARGEKSVEIRKMYLLPEVRGRGLGRQLLTHLEGSIAAHGFQAIWVETASVLWQAVALYESAGYRIPDPPVKVGVARCDRIYVKYLNTCSMNASLKED
ncbi:MAG: GNAT family N-acetyltransferase [Cyanobacteriota bacterium]|nr:GNAT family N-acetyltransferase [Cyanobacteriota bacterium]